MTLLNEQTISCPYCGEQIDVLIDSEDMDQHYIEDCQVCCKPIVFNVSVDSMGNVSVSVHDENDTYWVVITKIAQQVRAVPSFARVTRFTFERPCSQVSRWYSGYVKIGRLPGIA